MPTITVGLTPTPVYQAPAYSQPGRSVVITNTDTVNRVYYSGSPGTITTESSFIDPLSAESFDGQDDVWLSSQNAGITVLVQLKIGSRAYSPGQVAIQGNVNATVSGNVNVANTPNVVVSSGSLTATVSGPVQIEPTAGQPLDVSAAVVNITPSGNGYVNPGQTANIVTDKTTHTLTPASGVSFPASGGYDLGKYTSLNVSAQAFSSAQSATGAAVTAVMEFRWFDDAALTNQVYVEDVFFWVSSTSTISNLLQGAVPVHGRYLQVQIWNTASVSNISLNGFVITGSFRSLIYSSWRQAAPGGTSLTITGATILSLSSNGSFQYTNNLGSLANITPGTGLKAYPLPLVTGPVYVKWQVSTAALVNTPTIIDTSLVTSGNLVAGTSQAGQVWNGSNTINTQDNQMIQLPRSPCLLVVNPAATSSINFSAVGQEGY